MKRSKKQYRVEEYMDSYVIMSRNNADVAECYSKRTANKICKMLNEQPLNQCNTVKPMKEHSQDCEMVRFGYSDCTCGFDKQST